MCRLEKISTADVAPRSKVQFWNDVVSTAVVSAAAEPLDAGTFSGTLKRLDLGSIRFAEINGDASHVRRPGRSARAPYFVVGLVLSGEILCTSEGSQLQLGAGDLWLFAPSVSADLLLPRPVSMLAMCVPREQIVRHIACPEAMLSVVVPSHSGPGAMAARYLRDFWDRAEHELSAELAPRFADVALQLVASAYAGVPEARPEGSSLVTRQRMRIRAYIEDHLRDPELTPQSIADELGITRSYVHRLFSENAEPPARYILRRRLEECHRALSDSMQAARSVTTIAFEHGFNSLPHFCRVFRAHYGATPREVQLRATRRISVPTAPCSPTRRPAKAI